MVPERALAAALAATVWLALFEPVVLVEGDTGAARPGGPADRVVRTHQERPRGRPARNAVPARAESPRAPGPVNPAAAASAARTSPEAAHLAGVESAKPAAAAPLQIASADSVQGAAVDSAHLAAAGAVQVASASSVPPASAASVEVAAHPARTAGTGSGHPAPTGSADVGSSDPLQVASADALQVAALTTGTPASPRPAFLELVVNGIRSDAVLVQLAGRDAYVAEDDLARAGLADVPGTRRELDGRRFVSLASASAALSYEIDERALTVRIDATARLLGSTALDLRPSPPPKDLSRESVPAFFVNYAARGDTTRHGSGSAEAGFAANGALALATGTVDSEGRAVRNMTTVTYERPDKLLRFTAGDASFASPDPLGGTALLAGVGVERDLGMDPYLVRTPLPRRTLFSSSPSTLEVWVNGALVRQQPVAPGTIDLENLPVTAGRNDVRTVLRDAFGREQELQGGLYLASGVLAPGLDEGAWYAGARRLDYGTRSFSYGDPLLVGRHRLGVMPWLTAGVRLEATPTFASGGPTVALRLPLGELDLGLAASRERERSGAGATASWTVLLGRASAGVTLRYQSPRYANASLPAAVDRPTVRGALQVGIPIGARWTATGMYEASELRDAGFAQRVSVISALSLGRGVSLLLSGDVSQAGGARAASSVLATLTFPLAGGAWGNASGGGAREGASGGVGVQRSLPVGEGYGYRAQIGGRPEGTSADLAVQAQSGFGRYEAGWTRAPYGGNGTGWASASGAVVVVDGGMRFTRPVEQQGFALVRLPGVPNVRVRLDGSEVGRTDAEGALVVPGLIPYYGHRLTIADQDVPEDHAVNQRERIVAASPHGCALASFDVPMVRAITGVLRIARRDGPAIPAGGDVVVLYEKPERGSPIGSDGRFWIEGLSEGSHAAEIRWAGRTCRFFLYVPEARSGATDLGVLACEDLPAPPPPPERM